jgi:hypothetical protein
MVDELCRVELLTNSRLKTDLELNTMYSTNIKYDYNVFKR